MKPIAILTGFPMPPTANRQVMPSKGRLIKTGEARDFDRDVANYRVKARHAIESARERILPYMKDHVLDVIFFFVFHHPRLFTKTKKAESWVQTIDAVNRVKSAQDGLVKCLGIDDKYHFSNNIEKISCEKKEDEQVIIVIRIVKPRRYEDLKTNLKVAVSLSGDA